MDLAALTVNHAYRIAWECRDIGYGVEYDCGGYVYCGGPDWTGKHAFEPIGGGDTIYLSPDEITDVEEGF